jgi:hypothetical protein
MSYVKVSNIQIDVYPQSCEVKEDSGVILYICSLQLLFNISDGLQFAEILEVSVLYLFINLH